MSNSLRPHRLYRSWNFLGQNTEMGSLSLLQKIFPTQVSNSGLRHWRRILYQLSHKGSPRTLEWVAHPFASRSSRPRNWTGVSCIAGGFFANWATREAFKGSWNCGILCSQWDLLANIFILNIISESSAWFPFAIKTEKGVHLIFGFQRLVKWKREWNIHKGALEWLSLHSMLVKKTIAFVKIPSTWP